MKLRTLVTLPLLLCILFSQLIILVRTGEDLSSPRPLTDLHSPISSHYKSYTAKNPWNMTIYNGILYVATGDYGENSGTTPIFAYDLKKRDWLVPYITSDEALDAFRTTNGRLFAVGNDSTLPGWDFGNFYELSSDTWLMHGDLPKAVHCFDMIEFGGEVFFGIGTESVSISPVVRASSDFSSYAPVPFYKNGTSLGGFDEYAYYRVYNFFIAKGELYAFLLAPRQDGGPAAYEFYKYTGEGFEFVRTADGSGISFARVDGKRLSPNFFIYEFSRGGFAYFTGGKLIKTDNFENFYTIEAPNGEIISDVLFFDGRCYALGFSKGENGEYLNTVWLLDEIDTLIPICSFTTKDAYALSFAYDGESFFVGLGSRVQSNEVGKIYKIN